MHENRPAVPGRREFCLLLLSLVSIALVSKHREVQDVIHQRAWRARYLERDGSEPLARDLNRKLLDRH